MPTKLQRTRGGGPDAFEYDGMDNYLTAAQAARREAALRASAEEWETLVRARTAYATILEVWPKWMTPAERNALLEQMTRGARIEAVEAAVAALLLPESYWTSWMSVRSTARENIRLVLAMTTDENSRNAGVLAAFFGSDMVIDKALRTSTVRHLATVIDRERTWTVLPVLADALQDAGAGEDHPVVRYFRSEGPFFRGCRALDACRGLL